jgi:hypothetical protein
MADGTSGRVSLYSIIGNVCGNLGLTNVNQHLDNFARWCAEAEAKIASRNSFKRFECEIEVHNRRACLPDNFVNLIAIKHGGEIINLTRREFRMFNKAPQTGVLAAGDERYLNGNYQYDTPGQVLVQRVNLGGTFAALDVVTVTVVMNNNGTVSTNAYTYVVQIGDTITDICNELEAQINAISNIGYTAAASSNYVVISGDNVNVTFTLSVYTNSAGGTISTLITQSHVAPRTITQQNESCNADPSTTSNNLASLAAANINTGMQSVSNGAAVNSFLYNDSPNAKVYTIDNGYIFCNFIDNGKIGIAYEGVYLDENGWPTIDQSHEDAVSHYCMYMYKSIEYYNGKIPLHVYQSLQQRWFWLCGQARGNDEMPNSDEMKYLANAWNQLLPIPPKQIF